MERTLVLIKPDGIQRGVAMEVLSRLERRGLKIVGLKMIHMDEALAKRHYDAHEGKPFFEGLIRYITSCPIIAAVFEGKEAIEAVRRTMGETDPVRAAPGTIRGDYGLDMGRNLIHGSDSKESAEREIALFFAQNEIASYSRNHDIWITESE